MGCLGSGQPRECGDCSHFYLGHRMGTDTKKPPQGAAVFDAFIVINQFVVLVGDTGIEPVTPAV